MTASTASRLTLLIILLGCVAAKKHSAKDATAPEVIPGPKFPQHIPQEAIIVPETVYNPSTNNGFKPLTKKENKYLQSICGKSTESFARMHHGIAARPKQFPWALHIIYGGCTGVLISQRHALTAAHCFYAHQKGKVPCGMKKTKEINSTIQYGDVCQHKGKVCPDGGKMKRARYNRVIYPFTHEKHCSHGNDIALIQLEKDMKFDDTVRPICVANIHPKNLVQFKDVGFGTTPNLQYIDSKLIKVTSREIATKSFKTGEGWPGLRPGDSGGPVQATFYGSNRTYLAGIHSRGSVNTATSANVPAYADWICTLTGVCQIE